MAFADKALLEVRTGSGRLPRGRPPCLAPTPRLPIALAVDCPPPGRPWPLPCPRGHGHLSQWRSLESMPSPGGGRGCGVGRPAGQDTDAPWVATLPVLHPHLHALWPLVRVLACPRGSAHSLRSLCPWGGAGGSHVCSAQEGGGPCERMAATGHPCRGSGPGSPLPPAAPFAVPSGPTCHVLSEGQTPASPSPGPRPRGQARSSPHLPDARPGAQPGQGPWRPAMCSSPLAAAPGHEDLRGHGLRHPPCAAAPP